MPCWPAGTSCMEDAVLASRDLMHGEDCVGQQGPHAWRRLCWPAGTSCMEAFMASRDLMHGGIHKAKFPSLSARSARYVIKSIQVHLIGFKRALATGTPQHRHSIMSTRKYTHPHNTAPLRQLSLLSTQQAQQPKRWHAIKAMRATARSRRPHGRALLQTKRSMSGMAPPQCRHCLQTHRCMLVQWLSFIGGSEGRTMASAVCPQCHRCHHCPQRHLCHQASCRLSECACQRIDACLLAFPQIH